jgi:hypothetical protein
MSVKKQNFEGLPRHISMIMNDTSLDTIDTSEPPTANAPLQYITRDITNE